MYYNYEAELKRRERLIFLAGVVAGALVIVLAWAAQSITEESGARSSAPDGTAKVASAPPQGRSERCKEVFAAQEAPLRAAEASLSQWQIHVGAMNQLVTGVITLDQATQFWDQTRVAAERDLARYRSAKVVFDERTARCPRNSGGTLSRGAEQCAKAVAARARELRTTSVALATWREHVHHMEMLRDGEMTPDEATQLWLASWRQGVRELDDHRAAARAADGKTC